MSYPKPPSNFFTPTKIGWFCLSGILFWLLLNSLLLYWHYQQGNTAYQQADCKTAIPELDKTISQQMAIDLDDYQARAQAQKSECLKLQSALQKQEKAQLLPTLLDYNDFVQAHPNSPLVETAQMQSQKVFSPNNLPSLAQHSVCSNIIPLIERELIPNTEEVIPALYKNCGQNYAQVKQYGQAMAMYETFLKQYPNHPFLATIKKDLGTIMIADARQKGAGKLPPAVPSGFTFDGTTTVQIRNESPHPLRIVLNGPESQFEEIPACEDCKEMSTSAEPKSCSNQGPVINMTLKPGNYDIVAKSIAGKTVSPYIGNWTLGKGYQYDNCFFIVIRSSPQS
jgi:tetratricopeptide (TPR) repeat protein